MTLTIGATVLSTLAEHPVFAVAGSEYRWGDVALASKHWGGRAELDVRAQLGLTCVARTHSTGKRPTREGRTAPPGLESALS